MSPTKTRLIAAVAVSAALCAGAAKAGEVSWTIGVTAPLGNGAAIGTVFSNGYPAPVYVAPAPVFHAPPVVYARPAVVYAPAPVVYAPPVYVPHRVVVGAPLWVSGRWVSHDRHRHHRHHGHDVRGYWERGDHRNPPLHQPQGGRGRHYPS